MWSSIIILAVFILPMVFVVGYLASECNYERWDKCYICREPIKIYPLTACPKCRKYQRTLAEPNNLLKELQKFTECLDEVNLYKMTGEIDSFDDKGRPKYESFDEVVVCSDHMNKMLCRAITVSGAGHVWSSMIDREKKPPKPKYEVT